MLQCSEMPVFPWLGVLSNILKQHYITAGISPEHNRFRITGTSTCSRNNGTFLILTSCTRWVNRYSLTRQACNTFQHRNHTPTTWIIFYEANVVRLLCLNSVSVFCFLMDRSFHFVVPEPQLGSAASP